MCTAFLDRPIIAAASGPYGTIRAVPECSTLTFSLEIPDPPRKNEGRSGQLFYVIDFGICN